MTPVRLSVLLALPVVANVASAGWVVTEDAPAADIEMPNSATGGVNRFRSVFPHPLDIQEQGSMIQAGVQTENNLVVLKEEMPLYYQGHHRALSASGRSPLEWARSW